MKIIHFITGIDKTAGGTTTYMQLLSNELKKLVNLVIVTGSTPNPIELPDVKVIFYNSNLIHWFKLKKEFINLLKIEKPDIVHINGIWMPQSALFQKVAQQVGIKVVLSPHGMLEPYILNRHPLKKKLALVSFLNKALKNVDYFHATAKSELDQIRKLGYNQLAAIIPNGIEISEVKQKTEWKSGVKNILFLSRIHPKKGIELLIEAVVQLKSENIKITIAGVGEPAYVESLRKLVIQNGFSQLIEFVGGVYGEKKWCLIQKSDLFVLPTYSENFGIVVAEALSAGVPVITTTGTPWQELETRKCGWWIELSVPNLVKTINKVLICTPDELKEMGLRGRKLVEEKYDIKSVALEMKELYKRINNF